MHFVNIRNLTPKKKQLAMELRPSSFLAKYKVIHKYNKFDGIETHWVEFGKGKPLVCLHGLGGAWTDYWSLLPAIKNRKCFILDLPGCAKTQKSSDYSIEFHGKWLVSFAKSQKINKFSIEAICSSAPIAVDYASKNPGQINSLILHMPIINGEWVDSKTKIQSKITSFLPNSVLKTLMSYSWFNDIFVNTNENESILESARLDQQNKKNSDVKGLARYSNEILSSNYVEKLKAFKGRLLIIALEGDHVAPAKKLKENFPTQTKVFKNAHSWNKDVILKQNKEVKIFLEKNF